MSYQRVCRSRTFRGTGTRRVRPNTAPAQHGPCPPRKTSCPPCLQRGSLYDRARRQGAPASEEGREMSTTALSAARAHSLPLLGEFPCLTIVLTLTTILASPRHV